MVNLASDKQATEIMLLDIQELTTISDYFIICSAENDRQLRAIMEHIDEQVQHEFSLNPRVEGTPTTGWVILDYGDVVCHILNAAQREYYQLERLWSKASPVVVVQ